MEDAKINVLINEEKYDDAIELMKEKYVDLFDKMLNELQKTYPDLEKGVMFWKADNFHVYPRHFKYLEDKEVEN